MLQLRPTFSESWYRVKDLRARLRPSAQISRQYYRGERWYVVRDPAGNQYHRLSDAAYRFVGLLDGSRTIGEAWELVGGQLDDEAPTQPEVIQILSQLHAANLLESDLTADSNVLLRRHKKQMKRKMQGRLMNLLFPRIPLWDPDRFLKRWLPVARWILSPIGAIVWLAVVIAAIVLMVPQWPQFMLDYQDALSIGTNPEKAFYLFVMFWILKLFHEMGHAFACRRFGGECHEMGIMFLVFIPTPYVDASSAWAFPSRWQRIFVGAGGMIVELFLAAIAAFVYLATKSGVPVMGLPLRELMTDAIMIAGFTTVIFNANPLLRYDGYYILSDWLEIPNLQQKSREYLLGLIKRHVFRVKSQQPLPPIKQRLWLFFYGIASTIYRVFVGIMIILLVAWQVPVLGILMALGGLLTWLVVPFVKLFKYLALEPELHRKRGRAVAFSVVVAAAVIGLVGIVHFNSWPWLLYVDAKGVVEPIAKEVVNARQGGFVADIRVKDGQWVKGGDVLLVLSDSQLETEIMRLQANLKAAQATELKSRNMQDMPLNALHRVAVNTAEKQLADAMRRKEELTIRASIDGQVIAPELKFRPSEYIARGTELCRIETNDKLIVRSFIEQRDVALGLQSDGKIHLMKEPEIRLAGDVGTTLHGSNVKLIAGGTRRVQASLTTAGGGELTPDPRDPRGEHTETPQFEMWVDLANPQNTYVSGQRGWVRLTVGSKPLIWNWYNRFLQLIETKNKQSKWIQM